MEHKKSNAEPLFYPVQDAGQFALVFAQNPAGFLKQFRQLGQFAMPPLGQQFHGPVQIDGPANFRRHVGDTNHLRQYDNFADVFGADGENIP